MTSEQAKQILMLYRPGSADAQDPSFEEALRCCERDPDLKRWLEGHCATYRALREKFQSIEIPAGLKEQILSERKASTLPWLRRPALAMALVFAAALLMGGLELRRFQSRETRSFARFRGRMVSMALRVYSMDLDSDNLGQIQSYLAQKGSPGAPVFSRLAQAARPVGCAALKWENHPVSMICFRSGRGLPAGQAADVWLFIIDRSAVWNPPGAGPQVAPVNRLSTAGWSSGDKIYLLAADGDADFLRKFL